MSFSTTVDSIRNGLKPYYLFTYRFLAFLIITGSLVFLLGWGWVILFFMFSTSWIAPTHVSATSDKMLQFASGYEQSLQTYKTLEVGVGQAEREWQNATVNLSNLERLRDNFNQYATNASKLGNDKLRDINESKLLKRPLDLTAMEIIQSQRAGLISKSDAAQTLADIQQFDNQVTDSQISLNTDIITSATNATQLAAQWLQAKSDVQTKHDMYVAAKDNLTVAKKSLDALNDSSYKQAFDNDGMDLVFVSYDNLKNVKVGAPIYDCYLMVVVCRQVGTITHVFHDEQVVDFPLFNVRLSRTSRGVFAEAELSRPESLRSTVLFVGGKPLFL